MVRVIATLGVMVGCSIPTSPTPPEPLLVWDTVGTGCIPVLPVPPMAKKWEYRLDLEGGAIVKWRTKKGQLLAAIFTPTQVDGLLGVCFWVELEE